MIHKTYFKELREKHNISKEDLAKILKISEAQIDLIERGEFNKLPIFVLREILRRYKDFFKIPEENLKELYIPNTKTDENINFNIRLSFKLPFFYILFLILIVFFLYQLFVLISPPKIKIISPPNNFYSPSRQITIKGFVDKRSVFFINKEQVFYDENGFFEKKVILKPGINKFILEAINHLGIKNSKVLNIYYIKH